MAFETCKFYYALADAQLCEIESSTEILNNGAQEDKLGEINQKMEMFQKEMMKMMGAGAKEGQDEKETEKTQPVTTVSETTPPAEFEPKENPVESEVKETPVEPEFKDKPVEPENKETPASNPEQPKGADNPIIEDEEEEEIITTTKPEKAQPEEEEKVAPGQDQNDENEYESDQFRAPWENLEVALHIFNKTMGMHENAEEFENLNWNLKADILERQADLEIARENLDEGIGCYNALIDLCEKHGLDRKKSRSIAGILFKIGCAYQLQPEKCQAALDSFYEAVQILTCTFIDEVKRANPEEGEKLNVEFCQNQEKLKAIDVGSDKAKELRDILLEMQDKVEECRLSLQEAPQLEKEKIEMKETTGFKKPMFEGVEPKNLGTFGKGRKRNKDQQETPADEKENQEVTPASKPDEKPQDAVDDSHKRQKVEEAT